LFWLFAGATSIFLVISVLKVSEGSNKPQKNVEKEADVEETTEKVITKQKLTLPEPEPQLAFTKKS
ncbi:MAG: hypothetical protein AAGA66_20085, partial [Bacteroidota bacterium]